MPRITWSRTTLLVLVLGAPALAGAQAIEVEPNNTLPDADARPHFSGVAVVAGGIFPVGDVDIFRIDLAAAAVLRFRALNHGSTCAGMEAILRLYDAAGVDMLPPFDGEGWCGTLTFYYDPGTYYISIEEAGNDAAIPGYKLVVDLFASAGSEDEPNDHPSLASPFASTHAYITGSVEGSDIDYFRFTVPAGASVRVEMIEGEGVGSVCSDFNASVMWLALYGPIAGMLLEDENDGRRYCPMIDGPDRHPQARNLAGGTHFLRVRSVFLSLQVYRLVIEIVPPDPIFADDFDTGPPARVVINEFNANISQRCDLVELRVVSGGSLNGYSLRELDNETLVVFSNLTVATNDLVVVHINGPSGTCNPGGAGNETASKTQRPASTYSANYDTAWDWYSSDNDLLGVDNVLTLYDEEGRVMDAVLAHNNFNDLVTTRSENQAAVVAAAGEWQMVGGGVPVGGFVGANFRLHAVLELTATGTTKTGTSIQRTTNLDSNDKSGWTTGIGALSTWGLLNFGQSP
jgi:hypothetical protein